MKFGLKDLTRIAESLDLLRFLKSDIRDLPEIQDEVDRLWNNIIVSQSHLPYNYKTTYVTNSNRSVEILIGSINRWKKTQPETVKFVEYHIVLRNYFRNGEKLVDLLLLPQDRETLEYILNCYLEIENLESAPLEINLQNVLSKYRTLFHTQHSKNYTKDYFLLACRDGDLEAVEKYIEEDFPFRNKDNKK